MNHISSIASVTGCCYLGYIIPKICEAYFMSEDQAETIRKIKNIIVPNWCIYVHDTFEKYGPSPTSLSRRFFTIVIPNNFFLSILFFIKEKYDREMIINFFRNPILIPSHIFFSVIEISILCILLDVFRVRLGDELKKFVPTTAKYVYPSDFSLPKK